MREQDPAIDLPVISVFGSHAPAPGSQDYETARLLGRLLAEAGYGVATGGYAGIMSGASQGASEAGGVVIGVTCGQIESNRGIKPNPWVEVRVPFESLQDRLQYLVRNNDGIVVLPGGIGTLSEFALAWSYMQVGEMTVRPLVTLGEMWRATVTTFSRKEYGTADYLHLVYGASSAEDAVRYIRAYEAPDSPGAPGPKAS
jgi:uncharacterized protein (TIGR00730 family)